MDQKNNKAIEWNKSYVKILIDELKPSGNVLQVGFEHGCAADQIQKNHPKTHVIIERDPEIAKEAKNWANKHKNVSVLEGTWQDILPTLKVFDSVFFNNYSLNTEIEIVNKLNPEELTNKAIQARDLLEQLEKQLAEIDVQYSDEEIEDFYQKIGQYNLRHLPKFFQKMKDRGAITEKQYANIVKKYPIEANLVPEQPMDPLLTFLEECLQKHMHKGSRFSAFLSNFSSKYEDPQFFNRIITNPNYDYFEKSASIEINDYPARDALIIVLEKLV